MASDPGVETHRQRADKFRDHQNFFRATEEYREAIKIDPRNAELYSSLGNALSSRGHYAQAVDSYLTAIEIDPGSADYKGWATSFAKLTKAEQTETADEFDRAVGCGKQAAHAYRRWAEALYKEALYEDEEEKYDESAERYKKAASLDSSDAEAFYGWGNCLAQLKQNDEAIGKYQEAAKSHAFCARAHAAWGNVLSGRERYSEAIAHYLNAINSDPQSVSYSQWVSALNALPPAEQEKVQATLDHSIEKKPERALLYVCWGDQLTRWHPRPKHAEAIEWYAKAAKALPSPREHPDIYLKWGDALRRQRKHTDPPDKYASEAAEKYASVVEALPASAEAHRKWAASICALGKYQEAIDQYLEALRIDKETIQHLDFGSWNSAFQALTTDQQAEATQRLQQITANQSDTAAFYQKWGDALLKDKKPEAADRAVEIYEQAVKTRPDANAYAGLAQALCRRHRYLETIEQLHQAWTAGLIATADNGWIEALIKALDHLSHDHRIQKTEELYQAAKDHPGAAEVFYAWSEKLKSFERYDEAIDQYRRACEIDPEAADAFYSWGEALSTLKRYDEAAAQYRRACEINPEYVAAFSSWGQALYNSRQYGEADEKYRKVIQLSPDDKNQQAEAYENWADSFYHRMQYGEAIKMCRKALDSDPDRSSAHTKWGDILYDQNRFAEAGEHYEKIEENQRDADAYLTLGSALLGQKKDSEAKEKYEQAIKRNPDEDPGLADRYFYWGNALSTQNRIKEAIDKFWQAVAADADCASAYHNLAYYLEAQGRYRTSWALWDNAVEAYKRRQIKGKTDDQDFFRYFGSALMSLGRREQAEQAYLQGLEAEPRHLDILTDLVDVYVEQRQELAQPDGRPDMEGRTAAHFKAREAYRKAEEILERDFSLAENASLFVQWGQMHLSMEEYDKAEKQLRKALEKDGDSAEAYNRLGVLFTRKEDFPRAIEHFTQSLRLEPDDLTVRSNLAEAYLKAKLLDKAEDEYMGILAITADHVESEIGLGQVYTAMAEGLHDADLYEEALHHFTRAITIAGKTPSSASKILKPKERAAVYYAAGYARVKLHDASKTQDESLLWQAVKDFNLCLNDDKDYKKADRARKKIREKLRRFSPERLMERIGPVVISLASAFIFVLVQISYLRGGPFHDPKLYIPVSLGAIGLMIAGFYLPRLLKLKVAGIELEKSSVDQITTAGSIEISS